MKRSVLAIAFLGVTAVTAVGQSEIPLVSATVDVDVYGIESIEDIVRGRLSIVYAPEGIRLVPHFMRDTPRPPRQPQPPLEPRRARGPEPADRLRDRQAALWVWNTAEILRNPIERETFLHFLAEVEITRVFLYLASAEGERPSAGYIPFDSEEIGLLLAEMREAGAVAYALDGDRDYVLPENHEGVYRTVDALAAHNRNVPAEQRFHGVRYDIEPYLAPGFQGRDRQKLLDGYVELLAGVAERAEAGGLAVAVDIPFWFDSPDEETGTYFDATLDGETRPLIDHVMGLVDDLAIMNYRTMTDGPNGAFSHAAHEMALGERDDVGIFVGVETTHIYDEDLQTFFGEPVDGLPTNPNLRWIVMEGVSDRLARFWLVDGETSLDELRDRLTDAELVRHWPAGRPARVAGDMQSFYRLGADRMRAMVADLEEHFGFEPAYLGIAYHDYLGMKELLSRR